MYAGLINKSSENSILPVKCTRLITILTFFFLSFTQGKVMFIMSGSPIQVSASTANRQKHAIDTLTTPSVSADAFVKIADIKNAAKLVNSDDFS